MVTEETHPTKGLGSGELTQTLVEALPWTVDLPPAATELLQRAWKRFLPKPPTSLWVQGPRPDEMGVWLKDQGYEPLPLPLHPQGSSEAHFDEKGVSAAVCFLPAGHEIEGRSFAAAWKERLGTEGRILVAGIFRPGTSDQPRTVANLKLALAEGGFCLHPAEKLALGSSKEPTFAVLRCRRDPFLLRGYREGDEKQILELFERSFHHQRGTDHWRWEYQECPWGGPRVSLVFDPAGALVAHYAGYPLRFLQSREEGLRRFYAHQIGDTMTAPGFRHVGRGPTSLLGRSARHFFAAYSEDRVPFNYGFNVGNIQRFSMKILGARRVASVPFRRRTLCPPEPAFRGLSFWQRRTGTKIRSVDEPDAAFDQLLERVAAAYGFLVERNAAYLRWRYFLRPGFRYRLWAAYRRGQLCGWIVCRRQEDVLLWGDLLLDPAHEDLLEPLIAAALADSEMVGVRTIEGWFPDRPTWLSRRLDSLGFAFKPDPQDLAIMCLPFQEPEAVQSIRDELYYTQGDSDLF